MEVCQKSFAEGRLLTGIGSGLCQIRIKMELLKGAI